MARKIWFFKIFKIKSKKYIPSKLNSNQLSIPELNQDL